MLYDFTLKGVTPLLLDADDVELADMLKEWRNDPENRNFKAPGDDRSPPWSWKTKLYSDGKVLTVPSDNIMVALRQAGAMKILSGKTTYKSLTQSGLLITDVQLPIHIDGQTVSKATIDGIEGTFAEQAQAVADLGFRLFVKRAKPPGRASGKHVRVRPRFDTWELRGQIEVLAEEIKESVLRELMELAGKYKGIGNWRPSCPQAPGPFGRWEAVVQAVKKAKVA